MLEDVEDLSRQVISKGFGKVLEHESAKDFEPISGGPEIDDFQIGLLANYLQLSGEKEEMKKRLA